MTDFYIALFDCFQQTSSCTAREAGSASLRPERAAGRAERGRRAHRPAGQGEGAQRKAPRVLGQRCRAASHHGRNGRAQRTHAADWRIHRGVPRGHDSVRIAVFGCHATLVHFVVVGRLADACIFGGRVARGAGLAHAR